MNFLIREANFQDAQGIANVHVSSWIETYTGIVPESYLAELSKEERKEMWESGGGHWKRKLSVRLGKR